MLQSQEEISQLPSENEDILKRNMLDRYMDRPSQLFCNGHYALMKTSVVLSF